MDQNQGIKSWQWIVTVIVIIILIVLGYYMLKGGSPMPPTDTSTSNTTPINPNEVNRITVTDQYPGNIVYVSSVQLDRAGWVVIHKDNNGVPGAVIGSAYFNSGINPGRINLTSNTVEGGVYYAMLHADNGDRVFNPATDTSIVDSRGVVITKVFRATSNITEIKG